MKRVKVTVLYQCGRCSHSAKRTYTADDDGLLTIPNTYCGRCIKQKHFTVLSHVVTEADIEEADESTEVRRPGGRSDVPAEVRTPATVGPEAERRSDPDKADITNPKPETGVGSAQGLPSVPPAKTKVAGKPAK